MKIDLSNFICSVPFASLEIHEKSNSLCCGSWLLKSLKPNVPLSTLWNSEEAKEIRKSVSDGSYRYCSKDQCPYLAKLIKLNGVGDFKPIYPKNELPKHIIENTNFETGEMNIGPKIVHFSFDRTCNYKCPSCRVQTIVYGKNKTEQINTTIEEIETVFSKDITEMYITASGDPFVSPSFRKYLQNFDTKKYPNLTNIHLFTNASLWNKEMWDSMPNIHNYVKSCEISIDAGTKETYENVTRLGGNWDNLINNLKFISTIPKLRYVKTSFVVQSTNYKEMETFLKLMKSIFGIKSQVFFGKINNWGTFDEGTYKILKIWDEFHPEHRDFLNEFEKIYKDPNVFHNLHEFITLGKSVI
jgi:organic radical activating enzyme